MRDVTGSAPEPEKDVQVSQPHPPVSVNADVSPPHTDEDDASESEEIIVGAGIDFTDPNSPLAPLYLRVGGVIVVGFLMLVFVLLSHWPIWYTDVWAHLRFGEEIVRQRQLPEHEPFPESPADKTAFYIHYQWLAQAGAYLIFDAGRHWAAPDADHQLGGGALMIGSAYALIVTLRLLLLFLAFRQLTGSTLCSLFGVILSLILGAGFHLFILRPQILGELAFAALLLALSGPLLSRRALVWVPLVFVLWANCHGSFPMGLVLLGTALMGQILTVMGNAASDNNATHATSNYPLSSTMQILSALLRPRQAFRHAFHDPQVRRLGLVFVLSMIAIMLNPHGPALLRHSWELSHNPNIPFMEEWKPIALRGLAGYVFLASVLLLAVVQKLLPAATTTLNSYAT